MSGQAAVDPQSSLSLPSPILQDKEDADPPVPGTHALVRILVPPEPPQDMLHELHVLQQLQLLSATLPAYNN